MTTITLTEYAVQVEMEPGHWMFVMDETGEKIYTLETMAEAEDAQSIWNLDHSRVVTRQIQPSPTSWRVT